MTGLLYALNNLTATAVRNGNGRDRRPACGNSSWLMYPDRIGGHGQRAEWSGGHDQLMGMKNLLLPLFP